MGAEAVQNSGLHGDLTDLETAMRSVGDRDAVVDSVRFSVGRTASNGVEVEVLEGTEVI